MKVPPKRKGNLALIARVVVDFTALNESPSEEEGKFLVQFLLLLFAGGDPQ